MGSNSVGRYIRYIELNRDKVPSFTEYPFNLPAIKSLDTLSFHPKVTFIVGENGTGKSTILDEPEAALSPSRQMSMITRMHQLIEEGSQFIIATHSPIIMAYPHSLIYQIEEGFEHVTYEKTEHYQVMRAFVNNTQKMLKLLLEDDKDDS
ncbi:AAA family ATPase [Desulfosporosinus sp. SRJS8]|uniref:AAA family ATPase n=1 Tax=Desulfosporosinus shakirovi TaxID=2885154 RepID=UPI001E50C986|nr:AAA family ATPase [Desulfosporosinus sp. SRJS8]MCB8817513.1 AAA family ATPase [Desulfosporosinus sp. SRJS8]